MIRYEKGDLLESPVRVLVHGVNCQGVMGAGVALAVKNKYPEVFRKYKDLCDDTKNVENHRLGNTRILLGTAQVIRVRQAELSAWVINAFTQIHIGKRNPHTNEYQKIVSYDAIDDCMKTIAEWWERNEINTAIGMPKIGSERGGGHWPIIAEIINFRLKTINVTVYEL